jgi:hypothetical protein
MPTDVTIDNITGQTPFDVYICDTGTTTCIYINTINTGDLPYTFQIPNFFSNQPGFNLRVVDDNDCQINETLIP